MHVMLKVAAAVVLLTVPPALGEAQTMTNKGLITGPATFPQQGGAAVYKAACQGCHMPDAMGATGAATYPALARNPKLESARYPVLMVLYGHGAMPMFKDALDDVQIADVVTYVRTSFGNAYPAKVTAGEVKALRGG